MNHFLNISDHPPETIRQMLIRGLELRAERRQTGHNKPVLKGRTLAMLFEKPSLRTRVSFEQAMNHLGGHAVVLGRDEVGLGKRESVADVARVLGGMVEAIAARVFSHAHLEELAAHAGRAGGQYVVGRVASGPGPGRRDDAGRRGGRRARVGGS